MILVEQPTGGFKSQSAEPLRRGLQRALAEQFGGGGHKKAAGAFLNEPLESARERSWTPFAKPCKHQRTRETATTQLPSDDAAFWPAQACAATPWLAWLC